MGCVGLLNGVGQGCGGGAEMPARQSCWRIFRRTPERPGGNLRACSCVARAACSPLHSLGSAGNPLVLLHNISVNLHCLYVSATCETIPLPEKWRCTQPPHVFL